MAKCGTCENFGQCPHKDKKDDAGTCYYPNVYMEVNHKEEWDKYENSLEN